MIVNAVRAYRVQVQLTDPLRTGRGPLRQRDDLLVELVTDDGHSGWGNGSDSDTSLAALASAAPHVLGVDLHRTDPRALMGRSEQGVAHRPPERRRYRLVGPAWPGAGSIGCQSARY